MTVLHRATPERLSAFSDAVFAVLITVLVLELRPPEFPTFKALLLLWPTWLSYAVSYLFIAIVWTNHHYLMRYATEATPRLLWFNFAHLFSMSLESAILSFPLHPLRPHSPASGYFSATTAATPKRHKVVIDRKRMILRTVGESSATGVRSITSQIKHM